MSQSSRHAFLICVAGIFILTDASAQQKRLGIDVTYRGYMSNYEYFNPIVLGYTLYGNILEPGLTFSSDSSWKLFAGAWLQYDFGNSGFRRAEPNFHFDYKRKKWNARFGTLDMYNQHNLPEWIYDTDDFITRGSAKGTQVKTSFKHFQSDSWIAWRRMIYLESIDPERIEAGTHANISVVDSPTTWYVNIPVNAILLHNGGQIGHIDTIQKVVTLYAVGGGLSIGKRFNNSIVKSIGVSSQATVCNNGDDKRLGTGYAYYSAATLAFKNGIKTEVGFYYAQDYFVPTGSPLYQSRSSVYAHQPVYQSTRRLAMLTLEWKKHFYQAVDLQAWIQPYYDLDLEKLEYAYRLRLTYNFNATIKKLTE